MLKQYLAFLPVPIVIYLLYRIFWTQDASWTFIFGVLLVVNIIAFLAKK